VEVLATRAYLTTVHVATLFQ